MKKSISFQISVLLVITLISIIGVSIIALFLSNSEVEKLEQSAESGYLNYDQITSLNADLTKIHLSVVNLIAQRDIDLLEEQVNSFNKDRNVFQSQLEKCSHCPAEISEKYKAYNSNLSKVLTDFILIGKASQATDFFISNLSVTFNEISLTLKQTQNLIQEDLKNSFSDSKISQQHSVYLISIFSVLFIFLTLGLGFWI
ncbi:MAG: hypothetical protein KDD45_09015 [Bdellovibrionales bacterium]|nr:hypothetical protein [Bdellovibrionales bacterium]